MAGFLKHTDLPLKNAALRMLEWSGGTLILLSAALLNGFPLLYWDSASYIQHGFAGTVPFDRPAAYGLLVAWLSRAETLWYVALAQCATTALITVQVCRLVLGDRYRAWMFLLICLLLTLLTSISWMASQVMPDFFTPLVFMLVFLMLFGRSLVMNAVYGLLLVTACISHFSHVLLALALLIAFTIYFLFRRYKKLQHISWSRIAMVAAFVGLSWLAMPALHYRLEKQFVLSKAPMPFVLAHLIDNGVLQEFLQTNCSDPEISATTLCAWKDRMPRDLTAFLWQSGGVLDAAGGWEKSDPEFRLIARRIFLNPRFFMLNLERTLVSTVGQMTLYRTGPELIPHREGSQCYGQLSWRLPSDLNRYVNSRQYNDRLQDDIFRYQNVGQTCFEAICLLVLLLLIFTGTWRALSPLSREFLLFTLLLLFLNAFIVCALNSPTDRFQSRVMWLPVLAMMLLLVANWKEIRNRFRSRSGNPARIVAKE